MKILALDDHWQDIAPVLNAYLAGDQIVYSASPREAHKLLKTQEFDLLLLDGNLGGDLTGPAVLREWKAEGLGLPPVVMLSADDYLIRDGIAAGAIDGINKDEIYSSTFTKLKAKLAT